MFGNDPVDWSNVMDNKDKQIASLKTHVDALMKENVRLSKNIITVNAKLSEVKEVMASLLEQIKGTK